MYRIVAALALCVATSAAFAAQSGATGGDPTNPAVTVPAAKYNSAFAGYQPFREEKLENWRALNEEVARAGGHVGIFGGAGGHAGHGAAKPSAGKPAPDKAPAKPAQAAAPAASEAGQPPVRGAPQAPATGKHH